MYLNCQDLVGGFLVFSFVWRISTDDFDTWCITGWHLECRGVPILRTYVFFDPALLCKGGIMNLHSSPFYIWRMLTDGYDPGCLAGWHLRYPPIRLLSAVSTRLQPCTCTFSLTLLCCALPTSPADMPAANSAFRLQMFAKFAVNQYLILMKWSLEKDNSALHWTIFLCITILCAGMAHEWSFQAS